MSKGTDITIHDLAKEAGVSVATASRALSDSPNLSSKKQLRVIELAKQYAFKPNTLAKNFYHGKSHALCIVLPEITNPFYAEIFSGADEEAVRNGYSLVLYRVPADAKDMPQLYDRMISRRFDGVIFAGGIAEKAYGKSLDLLHQLQAYMPIVIIGAAIDGLDCVSITSDIDAGTRMSVRHLHALGHHRIALLGGDPRNVSSFERQNSFFSEMDNLKLRDEIQYIQATGYTPSDGEAGVQKLLGSVERAKWPTAVIAINDLVALGALRQLNRMGLSVPEDIALIGCDNQFYTAFTNPPLTTLDLRADDLSRMAVISLLQTPRGEAQSLQQTKDSVLIVRDSCGAKLGRRHFG